MGVCIETGFNAVASSLDTVTPYMGVCIETSIDTYFSTFYYVTPYMGVCIETNDTGTSEGSTPSHPIWVCVLKQQQRLAYAFEQLSHPIWVCVLKLV